MSKVYVEPGKSNPKSESTGHWKIMFEENGKSRHLNDAQDLVSAFEKAGRAAEKRGVEFADAPSTNGAVTHTPTPVVKKDFMDVVPPRGAPKKGEIVQFKAPDGSQYEGEVVDYLAEQFVIEFMAPTQRIIHINEDWKVL